MSRNPERIEKLSEAIAESQDVDWAAEEREAAGSGTVGVVRQLAFIARLADAHRRIETREKLPFFTWGNLRLTNRIGAGSYGEVFRAWDETLQYEVALKLYHPALQADPTKRNGLLEEARTLAKIRHDNVVRVLGVDVQRDRVGFWMELLVGETLEELLESRSRFDVREACEFGIRICRGLAAVHAAGVIHRDIKPANVFRETSGRICLLDFGAGVGTPDSVQRIGTPLYMAPETLLRGESSQRSDVYGLGVLLFRMVSKRLPVEASRPDDLAAKHARGEKVALSEVRPDLPATFRNVVQRCLETDPTRRFGSASEVEAALSECLGAPASKIKWFNFALVGVLVLLLALQIPRQWIHRGSKPVAEHPTQPHDTIAVIGFQGSASEPQSGVSLAGMLDLVDVAVLQSSRCRVVSSEYLLDLRRRRFGVSTGPISPDEALTLAREAGATILLSGTVGEAEGAPFAAWRLVDTASGQNLGGGRAQAGNLMGVVDRVVDGVLPLLASCARADTATSRASVSDITTTSPEAYRHYVVGVRATENGRSEEAKHEFESAIALDSTFALAWYQLGRTHSYGFEQEIRRDMIDRAWDLQTHLGIKDRLRVEAEREFLHGRFPESLRVTEDMLVRWPDDREVLQSVAAYYRSNWFSRKALSVCDQGLALYPDDDDLRSMRRDGLASVGRTTEAVEEARRAAAKNPKDFDAWEDQGRYLLALGRVDSATAAFERARAIDPASFRAQIDLATGEYARGDLERMTAMLEGIVQRTSVPVEWRAWTLVGFPGPGLMDAYFNAGRYQESLRCIDRAEALLPAAGTQSLRRLQNWRATALSLMGRGEEALASCTNFLARADVDSIDRWEIEAQRTFALIFLERLPEARASMAILRRAQPFAFGAYDIRTNLMEAAIELADGHFDACDRKLRDAEVHGILPWSVFFTWRQLIECRMLARAGRLDEAAAAYGKLLASNGAYTLLHYELAQLEERRGHKQAATDEYATCMRYWAKADAGIPEVEVARHRLQQLKTE